MRRTLIELSLNIEPTLGDKWKAIDIAHHRLIMYQCMFPEVENYTEEEKRSYIDRVFAQVLSGIMEKKRAKLLHTILTT